MMQMLFKFFSIILVIQFLHCNTVDIIYKFEPFKSKKLHLNFSNQSFHKSKSILRLNSSDLNSSDENIENYEQDEFEYKLPFLFVNEFIQSNEDFQEIYSIILFFNFEKINNQSKEFFSEDLYIKNSTIPPEITLF